MNEEKRRRRYRYLQLKAKQVQPEVEATTSFEQSVFPTASQVQGQGIGARAARTGLGVVDVLDAPKRALAFITGQGEMSDPEANIWAKPRETWRQMMRQKASEAEGTEQIPVAIPKGGVTPTFTEVPKASRYEMARQLGDQLFEIIGDPFLVSGLMKQLLKTPLRTAAKTAVEAPRKLTGAAARGLTKIPEETLTKYATKKGRLEMAKAYAREPATAEVLVRKIYKQKLPEEDLVETFIEQADDIPLQPVINTLEEAKQGIKFKKTNKAAIKAIDDLIKDYQEMGETVSAMQFREARKELDDVLGDVYEKEGLSQAQKAFKKARKTMKESLVEASPAEYKEVMKEYARKMDARSELKEILGKDINKANEKALRLLTGVERRGQDFKKRKLQAFDDLYGTNFSKRAETMHEARQIAAEPAPPGGKFEASLLPKIATGWGKLGTLAVGIGWPRYSGKILNFISDIENVVKTGGYKLPKAIGKYTDEAEKVQALALAMKPLSEKKIDTLNKLLEDRKKSKGKMKSLIDRNITKILEGKKKSTEAKGKPPGTVGPIDFMKGALNLYERGVEAPIAAGLEAYGKHALQNPFMRGYETLKAGLGQYAKYNPPSMSDIGNAWGFSEKSLSDISDRFSGMGAKLSPAALAGFGMMAAFPDPIPGPADDILGMAAKGKKVYHGSPHRFEKFDKWIELINKNELPEDYIYALRGDDYIPKKKFRNSWNRPDEIKTSQLEGVSAVEMFGKLNRKKLSEYVSKASEYGDNVFLVKGRPLGSGNDVWNNEIIIDDNSIVDMVDKISAERFRLPVLRKATFKDFIESKGRDWNKYDYSKINSPEWKPFVDEFNSMNKNDLEKLSDKIYPQNVENKKIIKELFEDDESISIEDIKKLMLLGAGAGVGTAAINQ